MYCCPHPNCCHSPLELRQNRLYCKNGHSYSFIHDRPIPILLDEANANTNEFTDPKAVEFNDNNVAWLFGTFRSPEPEVRAELVSRLRLQPGQRVLVTAAGTGKDLPYIAMKTGKLGTIFAQDFSQQMLAVCHDRIQSEYHLTDMKIELSISDAVNLPFPDRSFDAAFHFGGINFYSDIRKGIAEMDRVVKVGGRVVIADKGVAPWLRDTDYGKMIITNNPLAASTIPLNLLPMTAKDVNLAWVLGYYAYVIDFTVASALPDLDYDRRHIGRRGGSMRTRYFGQLEGVDPALKNRIYSEAERRGISRVDFLEKLLEKGFESL